jgi:hypothetical protein
MKKSFVILISALMPTIVLAETSNVCSVEPPIDTKAKAWCTIDYILQKQSCISMHGFERRTKDMGHSWHLVSKDKNPNIDRACATTSVIVKKNSGEVEHYYEGR